MRVGGYILFFYLQVLGGEELGKDVEQNVNQEYRGDRLNSQPLWDSL